MTGDLITWLRAQLDDDERVARDAINQGGRGRRGEGSWTQPDPERQEGLISDAAGNVVTYDEGSPSCYQAAHIAHHDPARVLAEVGAKRRILDLHAEPHECPDWDRAIGETCTAYVSADECPTLRLLALPYADLPGYREEWRP